MIIYVNQSHFQYTKHQFNPGLHVDQVIRLIKAES